MRFTTYRGLRKVTLQAMLTFAAMNLKKTSLMVLEKPRFSILF
ncbi:transposase [Listeria fleischmannii FSL S10-1203]|uniref:Transposase n=2 Tax=Listeria fleischmannii FSL S10-1203 TaxID=1265822 RepID=W7DKD9_9LIST|nr:transposase [Listeria fleischmannii FSL S10-1203]